MFPSRCICAGTLYRGKPHKLDFLARDSARKAFDASRSSAFTIATRRGYNNAPISTLVSPWMLQISPQKNTKYMNSNDSNWIILKRLYQSTFEHDEKYEPVTQSEIDVVDYNYIKMMTKEKIGVIIDVRNPEELRGPQGRIPGSVNIPLSEVPQAFGMKLDALVKKHQIQNLKNKGDEIIFHCKGGVRSEQACKIAKSLGFRNVKNYKGSMDDYFDRETRKADVMDDEDTQRPQAGWLARSFKS